MDKHACFTRRVVGWCSVFTVMIFLATPAFAQYGGRSQINFQATAPFQHSSSATDTSGNPLTDTPTRSAGFLLGYSFAFNKWIRIEGDYGASRNSQRYTGSSGFTEVQGDMNQLTAAAVFNLPSLGSRFHPYALAGTGIAMFAPTDFARGIFPDAQSQSKPAFLYGAGVDVGVGHGFGVRGEYRGLLTKTPDFGISGISTQSRMTVSEPTIGLIYRF